MMRYMDNKEPKSAQFFRYYNGAQKRLYAYLLMMVHNHSDAEDLLQETASALWEQYEQFDPGRNFAAWAIGIARNKAIDFLRQKRTTRPMFSDSFYEKMSTLAEEESQNVDRRLLALRTCIKELSADNQRLLRLRFEEGIPIKKLSQNSPYSPQALYKKISRIYSSLYNCIHRILLHGEQA
ncbi:MAG: sigma-70 family RNA polymerase sigma factor [Phycisphaerae bacterium]|nr:sigma-70 family RNA polymerase sigma factor [Phycisphaerae bacterium]